MRILFVHKRTIPYNVNYLPNTLKIQLVLLFLLYPIYYFHFYRFRSCLKMADTNAANFVGKLFFNVIQTKCFILKPESVCVKKTWWGNCLEYEYRKLAVLQDNQPF